MSTESTATLSTASDSARQTVKAQEKFLFDCDHLVMFCTNLEKSDLADQTDSILETKIEDLENRWRSLQASYESMMLSPDAANIRDFKENARLNFNVCSEAYYSARSNILDMVRLLRGNTSHANTTRQSLQPFSTIATHSIPSDNSNICIKVPPCDTDIFRGGYEEWPSFRDMFTAVYVNHPKLSPAQKLYHLRNKTKDSAGAIVKRYTLCDENFELAWKALKARYENKRVLVDNQIKILFNIPVATVESSESIQQIQSTVNDCLSTLRTLNVKIEGWDPILIYLISTKLPDETLSLWEQSLNSHRELPKWSEMDDFLVNRFEVVERLASIRSTKQRYSLPSSIPKTIQSYASQEKLNSLCVLCRGDHNLRVCPEFKSFKTQEKIDFVYKNKVCNNCLSPNHLKAACKSKNTCLTCKKPHHTLLHIKSNLEPKPNTTQNEHLLDARANEFNSKGQAKPTSNANQPSTSSQSHSSQIQANFSASDGMILLRTAVVQLQHKGQQYSVRALIDPGSQRTFLSENVRKRLQIPFQKSYFEITGIGGQRQVSEKECELSIFAPKYNFTFTINAIILPMVTKRLPATSFEILDPSQLRGLDLADPGFNKSSQIDLILGNDSERFLNLEGIKKNICGDTSAYNTVFGWVLSGPMKTQPVQSFTTNVVTSENLALHNILRKFWEQEEMPIPIPTSQEDKFCEEFYQKTTTRQADGRYVVRLPFKQEFPKTVFLGSSRFTALGQYARMEQNLSKNEEPRWEYKAVLDEYISLDHMEESSSREIVSDGSFKSFYLPHHAVVRPEHKSTKVRVVFNASRKSKSGFSLNDVLSTGPTLQTELISIILNWRKYKYVFGGDIQKMYRQIMVHPADRAYQKILFQSEPHSPIKDYELKTVTFGVACAPFLAIRTLLQLASDSESEFPQVANVLRRETYVDDILSGGFTIDETINLQKEVIQTLQSAGFPLKKITANDPQLLAHLKPEDLYDLNFLRFHETSSTKTLGIKWNALTDNFSYTFGPIQIDSMITKRKVLSIVAQLFDPAGWITPVIIKAKLLMQRLWLEGLDWDDEIISDSLQEWKRLIADLAQLESVSIPRWLQYIPTDQVQLHGFSDSSKSAFCACAYIRVQNSNYVVFSNLLVAKSKVAPIQPVPLPRLELNGAVLLAKLICYIKSTLTFNIAETFLWTDSSIVLGWLSKPPQSWETYVANRTAKIHEMVPEAIWRHVPTHDNPADLGTRGCKPVDLDNNSLWWNGPPWLTNQPSTWPKMISIQGQEPIKPIQSLAISTEQADILSRFSTYTKALRVISYIFRFFHNTLASHRNYFYYDSIDLTYNEIQFTKNRLIILAQVRYYEKDYNALIDSKPVLEKSELKALNPFLDTEKVLRVNGRLSESSLPYSERHPIIMPGNSRICYLYLSHLHNFLAHADCNHMCRMVQTEFYISRLKRRVKSIIHKCKVCLIYKHKPCSQIMGPLPPERCTFTPPFHTTGIDFAGPFELKSSSLRKSPLTKGYVCVFICFSTKAIHLELCSDLSSSCFQASFARFVGRRGLPHCVVSDNGRNFVGASRSLFKEFNNFLKSTASDITQKYIMHRIEWKFIPPHAPHMGGLWEAAVKSFKFHFKRIAGSHKFTFEQFATVLARIEGVLNSRPISAMSEDPEDLTALTPGHFLKGAPMMALPEPSSGNISLVNRWLKLKAIHHQFAIRWREDYLKSLHKRYKWKNSTPNLNVDDLVVVMDDLLPPNEWRLGRIEKTYHGPDNNVRVADVRIATGTITRPIAKLCYLPYQYGEKTS